MLSYSIQSASKDVCVSFKGPVDEHAAKTLSDLLLRLGPGDLVLEMGEIEYFNSLGIRAWVNFVTPLKEGRRIRYRRCTVDFINQVNMIPALFQGVEILSFLSEFICVRCGTHATQEFDGLKDKSVLLAEFQKLICPKCGERMYPDEDPEVLLSFKRD